jgi:hypothetical protein
MDRRRECMLDTHLESRQMLEGLEQILEGLEVKSVKYILLAHLTKQ